MGTTLKEAGLMQGEKEPKRPKRGSCFFKKYHKSEQIN